MDKKNHFRHLLYATVLARVFLHSWIFAGSADGKLQAFSHFGGWPGGSAIKGNHAYLIQATVLTVLDISGSDFKRVGSLTLPNEPSDIVVTDDRAFLLEAQSDSGLIVIDISDPTSPKLKAVAAIETGWPVRGFIYDDRVYIANDENLQIVDVSNPEAPVLLKKIETAALDVFVLRNLAYVGGSDGLRIFDVSNPADPKQLGFLPTPGVHAVFVQNKQAFCVGLRSGEPRLDLSVVNVADSTNPLVAGQVKETTGGSVNINKPGRIQVAGGIAYLGAGRKFYAFDVSKPSAPALKGILQFTEGMSPEMQSLQVIPPHTYAAMGTTDYGFVKIDVSNPANPVLDKTLVEPWDVTHLFARGTMLFVGSSERLFAFDYADPENPAPAGSDERWAELYRIHAAGDTLYGLAYDSLHVVGVSDPARMTRQGGCALPAGFGPRAVSARGTRVVLLTVAQDKTRSRLDILDVSDPARIQWQGTLALTGEARDLFVPADGDVAYVAYEQDQSDRGILAVLIDNPAAPVLLGKGRGSATPSCIWVSDTLAFVGGNQTGGSDPSWDIDVFSVADPSAPRRAGGTGGNGLITDLEVNGTKVFASIQGGSVYYFELTQEQREVLLMLLTVCHSPASIFLAIISYAHMICPFTCDGAWSSAGLMASGSLGVFVQALLEAAVPVQSEEGPPAPALFSLHPNYPNPFNPATTIVYDVKEKCRIVLDVIDIRGRIVATLAEGERAPGRYDAVFHAGNLPSGEYFCRIRMKDFTAVKKMVLVE